MKKLSVAYFGTPYFSARFLEKLLTDSELKKLIEVKLVVTQPDQPVGRKQILTKTPVKVVAEKYHVSVLDSLRSLEQYSSSEVEKNLGNLDLAFLFAYGGIIPKILLDLPKYGFLNTHPSLLPKYRGPGPIVYPLMLGDKKTGVTLIKLDEEIDHGPIITQEEMEISPDDCRPDLEVKLTDLAFQLFKKACLRSIQRSLSRWYKDLKKQDHSRATHTRRLEKSDGFVAFSTLKKALNNEPFTFEDLPKIIMEYISKYNLIENWLHPEVQPEGKLEIRNSSKIIFNYFRGLYPWPGIWSTVIIKDQEKRLKITDMDLVDNKVILKKVQLEGKNEVDFDTFNRAYRIFLV